MRATLHKAGLVALIALAPVGCGLQVASPDLFLLQRSGQGKPLTLLVKDDGAIRCDGGLARRLPDQLLLDARDLATSLDKDAKGKLSFPTSAGSVFTYTIRLQDGTISFADTAAANHQELSRAELFAVQAAEGPCGLKPGA